MSSMYQYYENQLQKVNQYKDSVENYIRSSHVTLPPLAQLLRDVAGNGYSVERKLLAERIQSIKAAVETSITECRRISEQTGGYIRFLFTESQRMVPIIEKVQQEVDETPFRVIGGIAKSLICGSLDGVLSAFDLIGAGIEGIFGGATGMSAASRLQRLKNIRAQYHEAANTLERLRQHVRDKLSAYQQLLNYDIKSLFTDAKNRIRDKYGIRWWHSISLLWLLHDYGAALTAITIVIVVSTLLFSNISKHKNPAALSGTLPRAVTGSGSLPERNIAVFKKSVVAGDLYSIGNYVKKDPGIISATDTNRQAPLHWAARKGNVKTVKLLIAKGARIDVKDKYGNTPAKIAVKYNHTEVAKLLKKSSAAPPRNR